MTDRAPGCSFVISYQRRSVPNCLTASGHIGYGLAEIWLCDTLDSLRKEGQASHRRRG